MELVELGFDDYLEKPCMPEPLKMLMVKHRMIDFGLERVVFPEAGND